MAPRAYFLSSIFRSIIALLIVSTLFFGLLFLSDEDTKNQILPWRPPPQVAPPEKVEVNNCTNFDRASFHKLAAKYRLSPEVSYFRRHLITTQDLESPPTTEKLDHPLLTVQGLTIVNSTTGHVSIPLRCSPALVLPISSSPPPGSVDFSRFVFGVSTTLERLYDSIPSFARFLTRPQSASDATRISNDAGLVVLLHNTTDAENGEAQAKLRDAGILATVQSANIDQSMSERYFSLVPALHESAHADSEHKRIWLVLIDDDTFFPHPEQLAKAFHKYKDAKKKRYFIGGQTEILPSRGKDDTQLQGGAGIFLSLPLTAELMGPATNSDAAGDANSKKPIWQRCLEEDKDVEQGDTRLAKCIFRYTDIQRTHLEGLHQEDMFGDVSGFYESGKEMLSIHHWKSWHWLHPDKLSLVGDICGEDCVLQRWLFSSNEGQGYSDYLLPPIILTNGYSVVQYPYGINFDWNQAENTFDQYLDFKPEDMDYGLGKLRPKLDKSEKRTWMFLDAVGDQNGGVRQWYGWQNEKQEIENLAELVWLPPEEEPQESS